MINEINFTKVSKSEKMLLMKFLSKYIFNEFSNISKPCYLVKSTRIWSDLIHLLGINPEDIKKVKKTAPKEIIQRKILNDDATILCLMGLFYFLKTKDKELARLFFYLLTLKFYGSVTHILFKTHCNPAYWELAVEKLSSKHLFIVKNGVSNAIMYLSDETFKKVIDKFPQLKKNDQEWLLANNMVYSLRTRIAQSMKSLAEKYYALIHDPSIDVTSQANKNDDEEGNIYGEEDNIIQGKMYDTLSVSICANGHIIKKALDLSIDNTGIRQELGIYIVKKLSQVEHREKVRFIYILFDRIMPISELKLERKRNLLIKKITSNIKVNKYFIKGEILELVEQLDTGKRLTTVSKNQLLMFMCQYLTNYAANYNFSE